MKVLVDSSVWVAFFRGTPGVSDLDWVIEDALVVTNDLILAELTPALLVRGERRLVGLLRDVERIPLTIDWEAVVEMQVTCLRHGINKVGIPDLIIAQQALQNDLAIYSLDKHFALLSKRFPISVH